MHRLRPLLVRGLGLLLILVPFVPLEPLFGPLDDGVGRPVPPAEWLLGLFVFGASGWLLARLLPRLPSALASSLRRLDTDPAGRRLPALLVGLLAVVLVTVSFLVFRHRPLLVDSVVQLFQAQIFATGRLSAPAPPDEAFFAVQHMLTHEGRWFAQYPPGHAALLALGVVAGAPWVVPVLLSLGTAFLLYRFAEAAWDERTARVTLALTLCAPFFWLMGASFMNHVTCLFFAALFLVAFERWEAGGPPAWALAAGLAIGAAGLARPLTALAVAAVFAPIGLAHAFRRRRPGSIALAAAGGLCAVALYAGWNAATTGDPFVPGYLELWGAAHGVGFHPSPWGEAHTPVAGLRNELLDLSLLSGLFLEWPIPALLPAGVYVTLTGGREPWDRRMVAGFLVIPAAYVFYWHRDAYLGPRFLYTGLLFLLPLTARALLALGELPAGRLRLRQTALLVVAASFAYAAVYAVPRRVRSYGNSFASMKVDLPALARDAGVERGIVFVAVSWGNRLLARMRGAGVSASVAERTYRRVDHCELERLLRRARTEAWSPARLESALVAHPTGGMKLEAGSPNGDPTLRLVPGRPLDPVCRDELSHDEGGYGNWLPYLTANDPGLDGAVLYVRDLRDLNLDLLTRRPGDPAWLHRPGELKRLPGRADSEAPPD